MTSFVNPNHPTVHPGVQRAEVLLEIVGGKRAGMRHVIAFLLVASLATGLVLADALVTTWDETALLTAWAVFCTAAFAGAALYADVLVAGVMRVAGFFRAGAQRRAHARADAQFLAAAKHDPRIMADLRAAIARSKAENESADVASAASLLATMSSGNETPSLFVALSRVKSGHYL